MAAGVSHELNNPLAYVLSNVDSLARDLPRLFGAVQRCCAALKSQLPAPVFARVAGEGGDLLDPASLDEFVECARDALEGTLRIRSLSRILGTFSRVDQLDLSEVSLEKAIEAAATLAQDEFKCRATLVREFGQVPAVWASEGKLSQVFLNMLVNAAQAIEVGDPARHRITVRTWAEKDDAFAEVVDTGRGIPPENLERIFEPFFTTRKSGFGSGLGLTMCKTLVGEFGGDLRVESEPGKGSRFVVRLPAVPKTLRAP
jgi:signal transduction histidine kinase